MAILAASIKCEPSAALTLLASSLYPYHHTAAARDSLLLNQTDLKVRGHIGRSGVARSQSTVTFTNVRALLTTPKIEALPAATDVESLSIRTEFRTHREFAQTHPIIRFTADLAPGIKKVMRHGVPAMTVVTERVTLWNTVIVNRQIVSRAVLRRAQPGVIFAGPPRNVHEAMEATRLRKLVAVFAMVATAYTADSAQAVPTGRTATGLPAHYGVVAVDPRVIPLGSHVFIQGYGTAIAADTGGAIIGNRIDLCMDSLRRALNWGRQPVKVYVLQE